MKFIHAVTWDTSEILTRHVDISCLNNLKNNPKEKVFYTSSLKNFAISEGSLRMQNCTEVGLKRQNAEHRT